MTNLSRWLASASPDAALCSKRSWIACLTCLTMMATAFEQRQLVASELESIHAYFAATIWTGEEKIDNAVMVVRDGKVEAVGTRTDIEVPVEAVEHRLGTATLIPGLVIAHTNLTESNRDDEYAVSPEVRAADGFDPFEDYRRLLAGGITTVQISPASDRLIPGRGAVVKLSGVDPLQQVIREVESLSLVLTQQALSPPTVYEPPVGAVSVERPIEPTRPQLATSLAQAAAGLQALFESARETEQTGPEEDVVLSALAKVLGNQSVLRWTVESQPEVQVALQLSAEVGLPWLLVGPREMDGLLAIDDWKSSSVAGVVLNIDLRPGSIGNPSLPRPGQRREIPVWTAAAELIADGAAESIALRAADDENLDEILFLARALGRGGITTEQILRMLTRNPAAMLDVDDRVGSLESGRDADFVVLSGEPLVSRSRVLATYVDGRKVFDAEPVDDVDDSMVIAAGHVVTPGGIIEDGKVSVGDGKICGVGASVSAGPLATLRDFGSEAYVVPGLVDMGVRLGVGGELNQTLALGTKIGDWLSQYDEEIALAREGGVTTALLSSSRLPSPVVAFKLSDTPKALKDPVAIRFSIDDNLTAAESRLRRTLQSGKSYDERWKKYESDYADYEQKLQEYEVAKRKYEAALKKAQAEKEKEAEDSKQDEQDRAKDPQGKSGAGPDSESGPEGREANSGQPDKQEPSSESQDDAAGEKGQSKDPNSKDSTDDAQTEDLVEPEKPEEPKQPKKDENLEPYRQLFAGDIVALVEVEEAKAAGLAAKLFVDEFELQTALVGAPAAAENAELLAERKVIAVVGPEFMGEREGLPLNFAAQLRMAQVPITFQSLATTGVKELPQAISYAVYEGLGRDDALQGLTKVPGRFLGLDSIGSLEPGKAADLVVLSGPPLELSSEVLAVMIDGRWVFEKESR